ncbi:hypothetical protein J5X84_44260 [Streptosporangiaceae bacterium NEAU-GS5]|nr:hypothetical protein [Streptosporangiaceae bacterium NEAU-GS5]
MISKISDLDAAMHPPVCSTCGAEHVETIARMVVLPGLPLLMALPRGHDGSEHVEILVTAYLDAGGDKDLPLLPAPSDLCASARSARSWS